MVVHEAWGNVTFIVWLAENRDILNTYFVYVKQGFVILSIVVSFLLIFTRYILGFEPTKPVGLSFSFLTYFLVLFLWIFFEDKTLFYSFYIPLLIFFM